MMNTKAMMAAVAAAAVLAGCSDEQQELRGWMDVQKRSIPVKSETVPPPKTYEPFRYENAGASDPFSASKLSLKSARDASGTLKPDMSRRREALEGYPLEAIRMVGHMSDGRSNYALLQAESMVYQARVGNYAGQNFGRIVKVSEGEVTLKELVQDAAGDWVERDTALHLQQQQDKQEKKK